MGLNSPPRFYHSLIETFGHIKLRLTNKHFTASRKIVGVGMSKMRNSARFGRDGSNGRNEKKLFSKTTKNRLKSIILPEYHWHELIPALFDSELIRTIPTISSYSGFDRRWRWKFVSVENSDVYQIGFDALIPSRFVKADVVKIHD